MSRLIVLSNRVKMPDNNPMAGGLAVALQDVLIGKSVVWMGWNGEVVNDNNSNNTENANTFSSIQQRFMARANEKTRATQITYMTTAFTTQQYQHFYCGFANNVLWPLLHEQTALISQAADDYAGYQAVNRLFARQLKSIIQPDDVIWVHDYHFLSVAYHCRKLGINNRVGLFLHVPFVTLDFWQQLEQSAELIHHLAHYDVLGTQTQQGCTNCVDAFQHYLKDRLSKNRFNEERFEKESVDKEDLVVNSLAENSYVGITPINVLQKKQSFAHAYRSSRTALTLNLDFKPHHSLLINAYPIGINVARIQQQVSQLASSLPAHLTQHNVYKKTDKTTTQQIIAVDRIDYSKGLLRRFSAYRDFLEHYPSYQNTLQLLQIACPSRLDLPTYQRLYQEVKHTVSEINQQFSSDNRAWQAIKYSENVLNHEPLMAAFWQSDIGWVNSLKDGMNLVAKEYIAAQNPDNPGVLMLSRYAGAAEQMQMAVIVDPHQPTSMIEGLKEALTMPLKERRLRHQALLQGLHQDDLYAWQQRFLDDLYLDGRYDNKKRSANDGAFDAIQMSDS